MTSPAPYLEPGLGTDSSGSGVGCGSENLKTCAVLIFISPVLLLSALHGVDSRRPLAGTFSYSTGNLFLHKLCSGLIVRNPIALSDLLHQLHLFIGQLKVFNFRHL